jgi:hypothetical protein
MRVGFGVSMPGFQHRGDVAGREASEPQALAARAHRGQQRIRQGGDEDEDARRGRFFQGLEQRVLPVEDHRVRLVDHDYAATSFERPIPRRVDRRADLVGFDRAGLFGLEEQHVRVHAPRDAFTGIAFAAGVSAGSPFRGEGILAIEQLRERHGGHVLANARRSRKNEALRKRSAPRGLRQQPEYMLVPEYVSEGHAGS